MRYRETFGLCLALAACAGTSTIGGGKGSGGSSGAGASIGTGASGGNNGAGSSGRTSASGASGGTNGTGVSGETNASGAFGGSAGTGTSKGGSSAASAGMSPVAPPASESCFGEQCGEGESCCFTTMKCFDPVADPEECARPTEPLDPDTDPEISGRCATNAHCDADSVCLTTGLCAGTGFCIRLSNCPTCDDGGSGACKVCACDGKTYPNSQTACAARTFSPRFGAGCGESLGIRYADEDMNGIAAIDGGSPDAEYSITVCGSSDDCPLEGDACCAITAVCYPKSDPGQCAIPPPGTSYPCTSNAQCWVGQYCASDDGCDAPGGCLWSDLVADDCGKLFDPVCGCNGIAYTSPACAAVAGTRVASQGECP